MGNVREHLLERLFRLLTISAETPISSSGAPSVSEALRRAMIEVSADVVESLPLDRFRGGGRWQAASTLNVERRSEHRVAHVPSDFGKVKTSGQATYGGVRTRQPTLSAQFGHFTPYVFRHLQDLLCNARFQPEFEFQCRRKRKQEAGRRRRLDQVPHFRQPIT